MRTGGAPADRAGGTCCVFNRPRHSEILGACYAGAYQEYFYIRESKCDTTLVVPLFGLCWINLCCINLLTGFGGM